MFRHLLLSTTVAALALPATLSAEPVKYGNRDFYGFFLGNAIYTNADETRYGFGRQTFAQLDANELLYDFTNNVGVYAGTGVDGVLYVAPYQFSSSIAMPDPLPLMAYNIYTGQCTEVGAWNPENTQFKPQDMTYDVANDRMLALGFDPQTQSSIYEVNMQTGQFTPIVHLPITAGTVAADAFGRVFIISNDGVLYQVDMTRDDRVERLLEMPYKGMMTNQTMEFDRTCNKLYWASATDITPEGSGNREVLLIEITLPVIGPEQDYKENMSGYSYNKVGQIGSSARFLSMYIPYCPGGFGAPGFATDIVTKSSEDGSSCEISFKAPVKCFNGEDNTTVNGYEIYRNGKKIYTCSEGVEAGKQLSYTDTTVPDSGYYRYDIVCFSHIGGDGPKTPVYAYVGFDRPAAVTGYTVESSDDFSAVTISWDAPEVGAMGGTYNKANTKYDIMRLPDNVAVATDLTSTTYTDTNIRRLLKYKYRVTAKNDYGSSASVSPDVVAGAPITELPLEETFENPTIFNNRWTSVDNNEDMFTWVYGSDLGHAVFGDYEMAAEYIISPTLDVSGLKDADDWIITPPIAFEDGTTYAVSLGIRSLANERFNVYIGAKPTVESMEKIDTFTLEEPEYSEDGRMLFHIYTLELPESLTKSTACVGVQLATKLDGNFYHYVQLGSITVDDATSGVELVDAEQVNVVRIGNEIIINGNYNNAALYTATGMRLQTVSGDRISLGHLSEGLYVLVVDGKSFKFLK